MTQETARWSHDEGRVCYCVSRHSPKPNELHKHHILPLEDGGLDVPENTVWLCPTTHLANVHEFLRLLKKYGGEVPWEIAQHYSKFARDLAGEGYRRWVSTQSS